MKIKSLIKHNLMRAAMTLALILACATAWAQTTQSVTYIDASGQQQTVSATPIEDGYDEMTLTAGYWYVVSGNDVYGYAPISVNGDGAANIILADGATFTYYGEDAIIDGSLNIYGQSAGTGKFDFDNSESLGTEQSYLITGDLTIYGGKVTLIGHEAVENVSNSQTAVSGNVTIYRGSLYAEGGSHPWWGSDAIDGNVYYYGGNLEARGGSGSETNGYGIVGNIYLSWSSTSDSFYCSWHNDYSSITIEANKFFVDEENTIHSRTNVGSLDGHILQPLTGWHQNGNVYTISDANGWNAFCEALQDNETYNHFSGKTVKLGANIGTAQYPITRMAGGSNHDFIGTFDGDGHTLTIGYGTAESPIDAQYVAPFPNTTNDNDYHPTFRNLNISGHIYEHYTGNQDHHHVGGLIGQLYGTVTIEHCTSSVDITSTGGAGGFVGLCEHTVNFNDCVSSAVIHSAGENNSGFVSWSRSSGHAINFDGCVFNGKLLKVNGNGKENGGFIGWKGDTKTVTITNCLVDPAPLGEGETMADGNSATFSREHANHAATINNCYYTTAFGTPQGKQMYSITAGDSYVTVANAGTATTDSVSGITSYGTGIKYNDVLYAGKNEVVSLTLSNTVPASFNFTGYSVTEGATLNASGNDYTLTMPNAEVDVVITANYTIPSVSYIDEDGAAQTCTYYYPLDGTETTLGTAGQEKWFVVQGTLNYTHGIQLLGNTHIILCDGAAMNIGSSGSPVSGKGLYSGNPGDYNLSIYAQSGNTGALNIYSEGNSYVGGSLTLAGGNVNATGDYCEVRGDATFNNVTASFTSPSSSSIICHNHVIVHNSSLEVQANGQAISANGDVTLSNVTANITSSTSVGIECANFAVDNSQLTVTALYQAIYANNGNGVITLGCTTATDFIQATCTASPTVSYSGTVKIADGQTLYAGANEYTGTLNDAERQAIGGQKLTNVAPPTYDYIDLDGTGATHTAVVIDADNMPTALSGWYIVQGTVSYTNTIDLAGDTHIILADNAVMNVTVTGYNNGIQSTSGNNYSLFVYGQTGQSGELNVTSDRFACYIIYGGDITIAGGKVTASGTIGIYAQYYNNNGGNVTIKNATVTATGTSYNGILSENGGNITIDNSNVTATSTGSYVIFAQKGGITIDNSKVTATATNNGTVIYAGKGDITIANGTVTASGTQYGIFTENGSVTINGGQVTATGNFGIYTIGSVTINGGQVTATGNNYGIFAQNSSDHITLGWTNPTDFIYVNKYYTYGTLSIAEGKTFIDEDGNTYESGTISDPSTINGKTLYPYISGAIFYLDENGQRRLCAEYTTLEGTETTLGTEDQETWYVVDGTINFNQAIEVVGNVHLILKDGAEMNVEPISDNMGISYPNNYWYTDEVHSSFSVYAQSTGADKGQLNVNVDKEYATGISVFEDLTINGGQVTVNANGNSTNGISSNGSLTINGGQVTVNANGNQSSYGISSDGSLTINGGQVTNVNGNNIYGINSTNSLTINGGQVTANGLYGIYTLFGNITLGWTSPTDYIYANSYFADGTLSLTKTFKDEDGHTYSGTIAMENETYSIDGKTLYPEGVIMKHITGYGENPENPSDKWVFIASPVAGSLAPSEVHNLLGSYDEATGKYDYDLYRFNQSADKEWENYNNPAHTAGFKLVNGMGYLYASKEDKTLVFAGTYNTDDSKQVTLQQGWNLVGNTFVETAYIAEGLDFYVMNADGSEIIAAAANQNSIAPMEGIIVQAEDDNDEVTFCTQAPNKGRGPKPEIEQVVLNLSRERGNVIDRAIVRMGESQTLPKFQIRENSTKIYLPQGGKDYAIACSNGQGEMPLNFRAKENGTYTITVNPEGVEMAYLHLIDNMTGADVDLLAANGGDARPCVSTYTFTAKTTDYESRFKLVFAVGSSTGSDTFAFISNGNIIVNGEGTLQIFDAMGRQLFSKELSTFNSQLSTLNYTPGVYVLRLINGENVRTQKIVIE